MVGLNEVQKQDAQLISQQFLLVRKTLEDEGMYEPELSQAAAVLAAALWPQRRDAANGGRLVIQR